MTRLTTLPITLLAVIALAGCGGSSTSDKTQDSLGQALDDFTIAASQQTIAKACLDTLTGTASTKLLTQASNGVDLLIEMARANPDARYDGETMRQVLSDQASDLDPCLPDLSRRLDRAVETL
jgi:hypothetical protein